MLTLVDKSEISALKSFARTMIWAFPAIFMGLLPWVFERDIHWWPSVISAVLLSLYFLYPAGIYYPYRVWMAIVGVLGWINTRLILGMAFFFLIFPIGFFMRSIGKLQYNARSKTADSFWIRREENLTKNNLEDPF